MANDRLNALTGLRFFAAALVVMQHSTVLVIPVPSFGSSSAGSLFSDPAVSLFFVLSGFVLTFAYPRLNSGKAIVAFYATRLGRIWPAHLIALLFAMYAFALPVTGKFFANFFMVQALVPRLPWYFSFSAPSWSISVEVYFYFVFPLLIYRWRETWWWKLALAVCVLLALMTVGSLLALPQLKMGNRVSLHGLLYINPMARLTEFVVGMVACSVFQWLRPRIAGVGRGTMTALEILVLAALSYSIVKNPISVFVEQTFGQGVWSAWLPHTASLIIIPFVLVVLALGKGLISKALSLPPLILLGEMSFSVYLIHQTVFIAYAKRWPPGTEPDYRGLTICILITLGLAFVVWSLIESPIRDLAKAQIRRGFRSGRVENLTETPRLTTEIAGVTP